MSLWSDSSCLINVFEMMAVDDQVHLCTSINKSRNIHNVLQRINDKKQTHIKTFSHQGKVSKMFNFGEQLPRNYSDDIIASLDKRPMWKKWLLENNTFTVDTFKHDPDRIDEPRLYILFSCIGGGGYYKWNTVISNLYFRIPKHVFKGEIPALEFDSIWTTYAQFRQIGPVMNNPIMKMTNHIAGTESIVIEESDEFYTFPFIPAPGFEMFPIGVTWDGYLRIRFILEKKCQYLMEHIELRGRVYSLPREEMEPYYFGHLNYIATSTTRIDTLFTKEKNEIDVGFKLPLPVFMIYFFGPDFMKITNISLFLNGTPVYEKDFTPAKMKRHLDSNEADIGVDYFSFRQLRGKLDWVNEQTINFSHIDKAVLKITTDETEQIPITICVVPFNLQRYCGGSAAFAFGHEYY